MQNQARDTGRPLRLAQVMAITLGVLSIMGALSQAPAVFAQPGAVLLPHPRSRSSLLNQRPGAGSMRGPEGSLHKADAHHIEPSTAVHIRDSHDSARLESGQ